MKRRFNCWTIATILLLSACQIAVIPEAAKAGSLNFGVDGSGNPTGGAVTIPYDANLDVGTGAFNLEMWVRENSRNPPGGQYGASFWSSTVQHYYHERNTETSSFMWGLTFDGSSFFAAWRANQNYGYTAGADGWTDTQTSNTKTGSQVYNTFTDEASHHIALSKTGVNGTLSMYLDGVRILYVPNENHDWSLLGGDVVIGGLKFIGQIGDVRLVKGQALYTGPSISVPTSQITTTSQGATASNVSLLLKAGGSGCGITDYSDYHHTVKIDGTPCASASSRVGVDVHAVTSYNLQFDNQGHGTKPADVGNINSIPVRNLPSISKDGNYVFQGWSATSSGPLLSGTFTATGDSTLFAIWATASDAPTIGSASVASGTSASVTFTAPTNNGGAIIESYTATSSPGGFTGTLMGSAAGTITVNGLTQGTSYTFTVKAYNAAGESSASSASNSMIPQVLAGPVFTSNTITGSKLVGQTLTANAVATGVPSPTYTYQWKRGGAEISGATSSTYVLTTADGGNSISVAVTATNGSGSVTNTSAETAPIPRVAQSITFGSLSSPKLTARTVTLGVTSGYGLATASSGLTPTYSSGTPALCSTTTSGVIQLLGVGTCSIIAAQDGNANFGKADTVTASLVITADAPAAPSINSVSTSGASGSGSITVALTKGSNNGVAIDSFTVIATTGGADTSIVVAASAAETSTVTVTGLTLGSAYTVAIKAHNAAGWSAATSYGSTVTPADTPYAVTALRSSQNGPNQLTVNFTPPASLSGGNFTSYQYFITPRGTSFSGTPTSTSTTGSGNASAPADPGYTFTGLTALEAYDVKVVVTTVGNGASLAAATALLNQVPSAAPNAPSVTLSQTDSQTVRMDWRTSGGNGSAITSYTPTLLVDGSARTCTNSFNVEGSYCTVTGLLGGQIISGGATATNAIGVSSAGSATSVTIIGLVGAPTSLVATPGNGQLSIAFALLTNGDRVINFAYSIDGTNYMGVEGTSSPVVISGLTNGTAYNIYLKAVGANNGIGSASAAVTGTPSAPATGPAPVVLGPPPSTFVVIANPKISRSGASLVCSSGTYNFKKQGGKEEASSITSQLISLLSNGAVVDSEKTLGSQASFDNKSSYKGTTMSCEVGIQQEEVVKTYSSLDKESISAFEAAMTSAIYGSNTTYYSERDAAYMKRDAGDTKLWKEMLDKALAKREDTKVQAGVDYLANLEKAGISLVVAMDKPVPTPTPAPTPTPTKSPEVSVTGNVQPVAMKKVGTIYFASGTYFLNDESKKTIKALASSIFLKSPATVLSYGFTDSKGGTDNTLLSQNRAKAVAKLLRSLLPGQKISTGWYASSKPVATGNSKAALAKNRRVEIYIK